MTLINLNKTPFPWFGGKADAAPVVWTAIGDTPHYVEPFAGSLAVLLRRPHTANRPYHSETVNDIDGLLVNAWRGIQLRPDETAEAASWPVSEADLHARHLRLLKWRAERDLERLMGDPDYCDPVMAGWWIWGVSCWIGSGFCSGQGPWVVGPDGRITKRPREEGVNRKLPHLTSDGQGVNRPQSREEGVGRQLPHLGDDGRGVNHAGAREEGVGRQLPHLGDNGRGVNHAGAREEGVRRKLPHLGSNGQGVNRMTAREEGVGADDDCTFHPVTMPEVRRWFAFLSARLRHVRVLNGDWRRAVTNGAAFTLPVRQGDGPAGIFLDPPYADTAERADGLYTHDDQQVAHAVREWCVERGGDKRLRIVLAGFTGEHGDDLERAGWRAVEWYKAGWLKGGMGNQSEDGTQMHRERLWLSPHCARPALHAQSLMFEENHR